MAAGMTHRFLCWHLAILLASGMSFGQTPHADKVRQDVAKIGVLGNITVSMQRGGPEYYGSVRRIDSDDFTINEVDQRREITLRYSDVGKVRADYGTTRGIRGRRIHPRTRLIVALAVIGGLLGLVFIAVASDKS